MMVALSELLAGRYRMVTEELEPVRALAASLRDIQKADPGALSPGARETMAGLEANTTRLNGDPEL
jgi:hypothetical protein